MPRVRRNTDQIENVQRLQQDTRELRLREIPSGMPIITFSPTDADLYNRSGPFEGWQINDPIVFSLQGNTVHVWGSVLWTGATAGYPYSRSLILRSGVLPAAFLPNGSRRKVTTSGGTESPEIFWALYLLNTGIIQADTFHAGTPGAPWGSLADFATPVVNLEFEYPVVI